MTALTPAQKYDSVSSQIAEARLRGEEPPPVLLNLQAIALAEMGEYESALQGFNRLLEIAALNPELDTSSLQMNRGNVLSRLKRYQEALRAYEVALQHSTGENSHSLALLHINIGVIYSHLQRFDLAIANYDKAIQILHDYPDNNLLTAINMNKGIALVKLNRVSEAINSFNEAETLAKREGISGPDLYMNIGNMLALSENYSLALEYYEKAEAAAAGYDKNVLPLIHINKGDTYFQLRQYHKALDSYQSALREYQILDIEVDDEIYYKIGSILANLSRFKEALPYYREAISRQKTRLGETVPQLERDLGMLHLALAEDSQARIHLMNAVERYDALGMEAPEDISELLKVL